MQACRPLSFDRTGMLSLSSCVGASSDNNMGLRLSAHLHATRECAFLDPCRGCKAWQQGPDKKHTVVNHRDKNSSNVQQVSSYKLRNVNFKLRKSNCKL
jgi:hypothetical protein